MNGAHLVSSTDKRHQAEQSQEAGQQNWGRGASGGLPLLRRDRGADRAVAGACEHPRGAAPKKGGQDNLDPEDDDEPEACGG